MLRLPDGLRERLKAAAESKRRSMNAEIVARIQDYDATGLTTGETIADHIERLNRKIRDLKENRQPQLPEGLFHRIDNAAVHRQRSAHEEIVQALEAAYPALPTLSEFYQQWIGALDVARGDTRQKMLEDANVEALSYWPDQAVGFRLEGDVVTFFASKKPR